MHQAELTDDTARALQQHVLNTVAAARSAIGQSQDLTIIENRTRDYFRALDGVRQRLQGVRDNRDLTDAAKMRQRQEILANLDQLRAEAVAEITEAVNNFQERHRDDIQPEAPESDAMLLEAKMQTARMDARMQFDGVPVATLPLVMHQAIESEDSPLLNYLLLATPWAKAYLNSRQASPAALSDWERRKTAAYPKVLSERQRAGFEALAQLEKIEATLAAAYRFFVTDRGL
jgi:hypothetical protein